MFEKRDTIYLVHAPEGVTKPPLLAAVAVVPGGFLLYTPGGGEVEIRSPDGDDAVTQEGRWTTLKDQRGAVWRLREMREGDAEWDQLDLTPAEAYEMCVVR